MMEQKTRRGGFTLIEMLIVIAVIAILVGIALPNLLTTRSAANESSAVGSLRVILTAETSYRARYSVYDTLLDLGTTANVEPALANGSKSGYNFTVTRVAGAETEAFWVTAFPIGGRGAKQFYTDQTGVIWGTIDLSATPTTDSYGTAPAVATGWSEFGNNAQP